MMENSDVEAILDTMQPKERFVFGMKYLYHTVKGKLTGVDTAEDFLDQTCQQQVDKTRTKEVGDFQP